MKRTLATLLILLSTAASAADTIKILEPEWIVTYTPFAEGKEITLSVDLNGYTEFLEVGHVIKNSLQIAGIDTEKPLNHRIVGIDRSANRVTMKVVRLEGQASAPEASLMPDPTSAASGEMTNTISPFSQ